jgi:hypothetical protein
MRTLLEITLEGDIIDENGESPTLFPLDPGSPFDPESLGNDPIE